MDVVFQLMHIRKHQTNEGIGLRQVIDLFWTLKAYAKEYPGKDLALLLKHLGLLDFALAMIWVKYEILGFDADCLICKPNDRSGRFVWNEINKGGNLGRSNDSYDKPKEGGSKLKNFYLFTKHAFRCIEYFSCGNHLCSVFPCLLSPVENETWV